MFISLRAALDRALKKKNLTFPIAAVTTQEKAEKIIAMLFKKKVRAAFQKNGTLTLYAGNPALSSEIILKQEQLKKAFAHNNLAVKKIRCV